LNVGVFFRVKSLEEEIEKLNNQLNEKKEQVASWEKSIENMKAKNNVSVQTVCLVLLFSSCRKWV
jgi:chromosome segregation ATPase